MNRLATSRQARRTSPKPPAIVAKFDLADERQRFMQAAIQRMHTGRWCLFRCLGMRQQDSRYIFEAVQWRLTRRNRRPKFSLLCWDLMECGVSWQDAGSPTAALRALRVAHRP